MANEKALYIPWNEDVFRSSFHVQKLTNVQKWMYRTLLCSAFFHSTRPYLPKEDADLWMLAGCESLKQWKANKKPVLALFDTAPHDAKLLQHDKLLRDWDTFEKGRNHGLKGARGRWGARASVEQCNGIEFKESKEKVSEENASNLPSEPSQPEAQEKEFMAQHGRIIGLFVDAWKEIKGRSAVLRPPMLESKVEFNFLVSNYDKDLLLEGFRLWAEEEGDASDPWALSKFVRVAGKYMQIIEPTKDKAKEQEKAAAIERSVAEQNAEIIRQQKATVPVETMTKADTDEFFGV